MSPVAQAMELQAKLAGRFKHPSDIDTSGAVINLPEESFTFVTVADHYRALQPLAAVQHPDDEQRQFDFIERMAPAYDRFVHELFGAVREAGNSAGTKISVCSLDAAYLMDEVRQRVQGAFVISLNEGDLWADFRLGLSRLFSLGGEIFSTHTSRPGFKAIDEQLQALKTVMAEKQVDKVVLVDDHAFSGKTIESVVTMLSQQGIEVERVVTYTRVNSLAALEKSGIPVQPVKSFGGERLLDRADLVEPRYFLIGAAGCVVELPNNSLARAPYVLPFGSPNARASIPDREAAPFSRRILALNQDFFRSMQEILSRPPLVSDLDPLVVRLMGFHGFSGEMPVQQVLALCTERLEDRVARRKDIERVQSKLRPLGLPGDIVFLDINDTILKSGDSDVNVLVKEQLKRRIRALQELGVHVGLCSDSPLPQMERFADSFGIKGPLIAENGSIIANDGQKTILNRLEGIDRLRERIRSVASRLQREQGEDRVAVEFGGASSPTTPGTYSFGRNREATISVFGDPALIRALEAEFKEDTKTLGIDANPNAGSYGFFAIHPAPVARGKAETLRMLARFGIRVTIIGNSDSDFVEPVEFNGGRIDVGMVGNHTLSPEKLRRCTYRTVCNYTMGVCNILRQIERDREGVVEGSPR